MVRTVLDKYSFASHDMNNNAYGFLYQVGVKIKKEEKNTPKHMRCSVWRYMYKNENHITNVYKNMPLIGYRCINAYFEPKIHVFAYGFGFHNFLSSNESSQKPSK